MLFILNLTIASLCFGQQTTIINHYEGDEVDGARYVLKSTERHSVVINYYEPAPQGDEQRMQMLISDALDFYIDRSISFDGQAIQLKSRANVMRRDLNEIVENAVRYYHFRELTEFKGFSEAILVAIQELDGKRMPNDWQPEIQGGPISDKRFFFVEAELNTLKQQLREEVDFFASGNLLVHVSSSEKELQTHQDSLLQAVRDFRTNDPLAPMEIEFSASTMNLLAGNDDFILPPFADAVQSQAQFADSDLADRIMEMLERNSDEVQKLSGEIEAIRTKDRGNEIRALQKQVDELNSLLRQLLDQQSVEVFNDQMAGVSLPPPQSRSLPPGFSGFSIHFVSGGIRLDLNAQLQLNELLELLAYDASMKIMVTGYADRSGDRDRNMQLSQTRARAVRNHLLAAGIEPHRVLVNYFGEERATGSPSDRRVEVSFL